MTKDCCIVNHVNTGQKGKETPHYEQVLEHDCGPMVNHKTCSASMESSGVVQRFI